MTTAPGIVSKIREALEQAETLAINENSDIACQQIAELMPVALALLPQLEAMLAKDLVSVDVFENAMLACNEDAADADKIKAGLEAVGVPYTEVGCEKGE